MSLSRRLASQSSLIFGARLLGAGLIFITQALIARNWGAELLGEYLIVVASVNLIAVTMPLGFHTVGTYFAAEYRAKGDRRQLIAFLVRSYGHVALMMVLILLLGPSLLDWIGQGDSVVALHFVPVMMLAFGTAMVYVSGTVLIGLKRPFAGFFADTMFRPMVVLGSFVICLAMLEPVEGFEQFLWFIGIGYTVVSLLQFVFVLTGLDRVENTADETRPLDRARWWRFAAPWVLIALASDFFFDIDLLLLAHSLNREELAIFGVCTRIFSLVSFGVSAVYAVTLPDMFESEANADHVAFQRKIGEANAMASLISLVLFVLVLIGAPFALLLFGPSFVAGAVPLAILCLGLVMRAVMGPASMVLSMYDHPWASLPAVAVAVGTLLVCNFLLVPVAGLTGAALAALIAIAVWSIGLWYTAMRLAGIDVSIMQWLRNRKATRIAAS